jgi:hypothetical protein
MSEERKTAAEARFARNREFAFRVIAHRNRLLARWAAIKMGLPADHADRYAVQFATSEICQQDDDAIVTRLRDDFLSHGVVISTADIRRHLANFAKIALRELSSGAA